MTATRSRFAVGLGWTLLFGAAFGFVEAAVVVYLREIYYPEGFRFPLVLPERRILAVELVRELATILMILAVANLARRTPWGRFGVFCVVFGAWDLAYYAGLWAVLRWPESLATWDILFLIPGVWLGPVWSAALIAVSLVAAGARILRLDEAGFRPQVGWWRWAAALASFALLVGSFLAAGAGGAGERPPESFALLPYFAGFFLGWGIFLATFPTARRGGARGGHRG